LAGPGWLSYETFAQKAARLLHFCPGTVQLRNRRGPQPPLAG
jgi:hypothetical protein